MGLVVDDAIVMLENIERHVNEGMNPKDAAITAARELVGPTIAMTITLAAVYAPIGIQGGLTGALFKEFALTLSGALIFVFFNATTLNIYSQVGLATLVGLIAKNGILIVEFANKQQEKGLTKLEAIVEACGVRLRPVLMTSVATVVGHFPLILATGAGAGSRNSIGAVLVSGMIIGTFFTLFVLPTIYSLVAAEHKKDVTNQEDDLKHFSSNGQVVNISS